MERRKGAGLCGFHDVGEMREAQHTRRPREGKVGREEEKREEKRGLVKEDWQRF